MSNYYIISNISKFEINIAYQVRGIIVYGVAGE
jgi:hypothetical protein